MLKIIQVGSVGRRGSSPGITVLRYIDAGSNRSREASEGHFQMGRRYTEGEGTGTDRNRQRRMKTQRL